MFFKYLGMFFGIFMAFYHFFLSHLFPTLLAMTLKWLARGKKGTGVHKNG